jgi:hypothetical protein
LAIDRVNDNLPGSECELCHQTETANSLSAEFNEVLRSVDGLRSPRI